MSSTSTTGTTGTTGTVTAAVDTATNNDEARRTSYAYYFVFISLGMIAGILGPSLDVFKERSGTSDKQVAILFTVMAVGYTIGGAITGRLYDRRPGHPIVALGLLGSGVMIAALTGASSLLALGVLLALMGLASSAVDNGGNTLITWLHPVGLGPWMIGLHAAFGVGSALVPLVLAVSRRSTHGGIDAGLVTVAALALLAIAVVLPRPSPAHVSTDRAVVDERPKPEPRRSALAMCSAFFFSYVGLEIAFAGWVFTFATDRGFSATKASLLTSTFWWAFTAGRVLGIAVARRLDAKGQILLDVVVTVIGAVLLVLSSRGDAYLWTGTVVLGLGLATMFPAMINIANERVAVTGAVTSWFIVGAGAGSAVLPWLTGQLFDRHGSRILPWFILAATGAVVVASMAAARLLERSGH